MTTIHPFEKAGLGKAPFFCTGIISILSSALAEANPKAYMNAIRSLPKGVGYCHLCGMPLTHNYQITSQDGKVFYVGCECLKETKQVHNKTTRKETQLQKQLKMKMKKIQLKKGIFYKNYGATIDFLQDNYQDNKFYTSLLHYYNTTGELTTGQLLALQKSINKFYQEKIQYSTIMDLNPPLYGQLDTTGKTSQVLTTIM